MPPPPAMQQAPAAKAPASYLPLVIIGAFLVFATLAVVLYFMLKK